MYSEDDRSAKPRLTYGETCWQAIDCFSAQERSTRLFLNGGSSSRATRPWCCWRCASKMGWLVPFRGGDGGGVSVKSMTSMAGGLEAPEGSTRLMKAAGEHLKQGVGMDIRLDGRGAKGFV